MRDIVRICGKVLVFCVCSLYYSALRFSLFGADVVILIFISFRFERRVGACVHFCKSRVLEFGKRRAICHLCTER